MVDRPLETTEEIVTCLTLWRPWGEWIAADMKSIETRLHDRFRTFEGRRIAIHSGMKWDQEALRIASRFVKPSEVEELRAASISVHPGSVLCTALVKEARWLKAVDSRNALIDCGIIRRFGLVLTDIRPAVPGIIVKGHQGPFQVTVRTVDPTSTPRL
jgi:hypothetical protein